MNNLILFKEKAWNNLKGNEYLKRAIEVALKGQHTITIIGNFDNGLNNIKDIFKPRYFEDAIFNENLLTFIEPCPCGFFKDPLQECNCNIEDITNYIKTDKYKQAMINEIIVKLETPEIIYYNHEGESFKKVFDRLILCKNIAINRELDKQAKDILNIACIRLHFTIGQWERCLSVANTIAAMDDSEVIKAIHISETIGYINKK